MFYSPFFPTQIVVVSEERLKEAELKARREQVEAVQVRIDELTEYKSKLEAKVAELSPAEAA